MNCIPILFGYQDIVLGEGFIAAIEVDGRALIETEDDEIWITGVNPGGISSSGDSQQAAMAAFREEYRDVLVELAKQTSNFKNFEEELQAFLDNVQPKLLGEWQTAVEEVRTGQIHSDDLVKRDSRSFSPRITAHLLETQKAKPSKNPETKPAELAA